MPCYAMLCHAMPCYAILWLATFVINCQNCRNSVYFSGVQLVQPSHLRTRSTREHPLLEDTMSLGRMSSSQLLSMGLLVEDISGNMGRPGPTWLLGRNFWWTFKELYRRNSLRHHVEVLLVLSRSRLTMVCNTFKTRTGIQMFKLLFGTPCASVARLSLQLEIWQIHSVPNGTSQHLPDSDAHTATSQGSPLGVRWSSAGISG